MNETKAINKIAAVMGLKGEYKIIPVICPWPTRFGIPGFIPCSEERCNGYVTQKVLTRAEMTDMMSSDVPITDTIVKCKYCKPFDFELPIIIERVRA